MQITKFLRENRVFIFFVFLCVFPTLRVITIGSSSSDSLVEYLISALPEMMLFVISASYFLKFVRGKKPIIHFIDIAVGVFVVYALIAGSILSNDLKASLYGIRLSYLPVVFYFLVSGSQFRLVQLEIFLHRFFTLSLGIALVGLIIYVVFPEFQTYMNSLVTDRKQAAYFVVRMTSIFWTPVVFGVIVSSSILYWQYRYFQEEKKVYLVYLTLLFVCLFLSVSRGPMIGGFLGVIFMGVLVRKWRAAFIVFGLFLITYVSTAYYIKSPVELTVWIFSSTQSTFDMDEDNTRAKLVHDAVEKLEKHPMGLGLGKAGHVAVQLNTENREDISLTTTDGWYLKLLLETGYISLALYLVILIAFVRECVLYLRRHSFDLMTFVFAFGGVVALQCFVSNLLDFYMFSYLYWFILGIGVYLLKNSKHGAA